MVEYCAEDDSMEMTPISYIGGSSSNTCNSTTNNRKKASKKVSVLDDCESKKGLL